MMDVSGSMTDEQKEIVRIEAFWIDTWIKAHYKGVETVYIIHDAAAQEVDEHTFYHTRESGGTKISSAYNLADKIITARYPPDAVEHLRLPLLRRRQLGRRHPALHRDCCSEKLLPKREPVRLRPGGKPLRQRRVLRIRPRDCSASARTWCAAASPTARRSSGRSRSSWAPAVETAVSRDAAQRPLASPLRSRRDRFRVNMLNAVQHRTCRPTSAR